jgi:hypothetical protein
MALKYIYSPLNTTKMQVFVSSNGGIKSLTLEVEASAMIGKLMQKAYPEMKNNSDFKEDSEVYLANQEDDLDKGKTLEACGVKNGDSLFIGKCKKVNVSVNYEGRTFSLVTSPSIQLRVLKSKVAEHFGMDPEEVSEFQFLLNEEIIDNLKIMIGSLMVYPNCSIELVFAPKKDINGFINSPEELLKLDLEKPEYLSGEFDSDWGKVEIENGPQWPISIFWVRAKGNLKYYLRFDLTNYNQEAPTAQLWDIETNLPLAQEHFPKWSKRCLQVFKIWGNQCIYLPCDRMAINGHSDWPVLHAYLVWKSGIDSIHKYLNEVHQILN